MTRAPGGRPGLAAAALALAVAACGAPPVPMPGGDGESCARPFRLLGDRLEATTSGYRDDEGSERSPCGGGGAPDLVVSFTAAGGTLVTATVTTTSSAFQPIIKVRGADRGCVDLDDACNSAIARGKSAEVTDWSPALSGTHHLVIDGQAQSEGPFTLTVVVR